ncbi:hypothetical protein EJ04DRAFT_559091 [Polyplosphaeria fusca]|uniref:Uncharacterized protein n=1 Tax=Polyplosphaeria fusca TaxID=682080 RepID=A0A9P4RB69_9PLEO|nr:hypothetical protein EJ04DRAFT_559091 [Polyplosphaeria fusca]
MESPNDLLNLPTAQESQSDRWYSYPRTVWTTRGHDSMYPDSSEDEDLYSWRRRQHNAYTDHHHHDEIIRLQCLIADTDLLINQYSKSAFASIRMAKHKARKARLLDRLHTLEAGWAKIIPEMRQHSAALFALPREIRERIYSCLYTLPTEIILDSPDLDVRYSLLPRDPFHYLSAAVVHPVIAAEVAQTLYDTNVFKIDVSRSRDILSTFLTTDHFGSGLCPGDIIRRLKISTAAPWVASDEKWAEHRTFEEEIHDDVMRWSDDRVKLAPVLDMPELRLLELRITWAYLHSAFELRVLSPFIKTLIAKGVRVRVVLEEEDVGNVVRDKSTLVKDISDYFVPPWEADRETVEREGALDLVELQRGIDDGDSWRDTETRRRIVESVSAAQWRVFLHEHYKHWLIWRARDCEGRLEDCR